MVWVMMVSYTVVGVCMGLLYDRLWVALDMETPGRTEYFILSVIFWPLMWVPPVLILTVKHLADIDPLKWVNRLLIRVNGGSDDAHL